MLHVTSTAGIEIAVHDLGGEGRPALFAHATGFHGRVWEPLASKLSGVHGWAPDLRGHGDSPVPRGHEFAWSRFADDVLSTLDALGLGSATGADQPIGIGHSKGGAALLLAEQRRPGTFAALWCYEPVVFPGDTIVHPRRREPPGSRCPPSPCHLRLVRRRLRQLRRQAPAERLRPHRAARLRRARLRASRPTAPSRSSAAPTTRHRSTRWPWAATPSSTSARWPARSPSCGGTPWSPGRRASPTGSPTPCPGATSRPTTTSGHFGPLEAPGRMAASVQAVVDAV